MASEQLKAVFAVLKGRERDGAGEDPAVEYSTDDVPSDVLKGAFTLISDVVRAGVTGVSGADGLIYGKRHLGTGVTAFSRSELITDSARRSVFHHHVIGLRTDNTSEEFLRIRPWDLNVHFIGNDEYLGIPTDSQIGQVLTDRTQAITRNSVTLCQNPQSSSSSIKSVSLSASLSPDSASLIADANSWLNRLPAAVENAASILVPASSRAPGGNFDFEIDFEGSESESVSDQVVDMPGAWSWLLRHRPESVSLRYLLGTVSPAVSAARFSGIQKLELAKALIEDLLTAGDVDKIVTFLREVASASDAFSVTEQAELSGWIEQRIRTVQNSDVSDIRPLQEWIAESRIDQNEEDSSDLTPTPPNWHVELVNGLAAYSINDSSRAFMQSPNLTEVLTAIKSGEPEPETAMLIGNLLSDRADRTAESLTGLLLDETESSWCLAAGFLFAVSVYAASNGQHAHNRHIVELLDDLMPRRSIYGRLLFQHPLRIQGPSGMKNSIARRSLLLSSISRVRAAVPGTHSGVDRTLKILANSFR
jgi:hypothetical protein